MAPQDAALWLGAEPRTLTELELRRVEVGPGSAAAGGLSGRPALRLTYEDAAGQEIVLMQQWTGAPRDDAFAAEPVLTVLPTGRRLLRWSDDEGYRLILEGTLSGDSLRALAARLR